MAKKKEQEYHIGGSIYPCPYCGGDMAWQSDFNFDEVHGEGDGIVSYYECVKCGAMSEISIADDDDAKEQLDYRRQLIKELKEQLKRNREKDDKN